MQSFLPTVTPLLAGCAFVAGILGLASGCGGGALPLPPGSSSSVGSVPVAESEPNSASSSAPSKRGGVSGDTVAHDEAPPEPEPPPALPRGTLVLHVGDSFAEALGAALGRKLVSAGLRNVLQARTPSYIPVWAYRPDLKNLLDRYNPDLLLITLGANEFDIPNPDGRIPAVERIAKTAGGRPCVWISPPRWKKDSGILAVIRDHAAPCWFLDSDSIVQDLPRARDRIHPSEPGREAWADAVLRWLTDAREPDGPLPWSLRPRTPDRTFP